MNKRGKISFDKWIEACARHAMGFEWCIDPEWPRWRKMYNEGLTPGQAVDELFLCVRKTNKT